MSTSSSSEPSEPDQRSHPLTNEIVIGRQPRAILWFAVFWLIFWITSSIALTYNPPPTFGRLERSLFVGSFSLFFFLPGLLWLWTAIRVCVIAGAKGLQWRGMGGWLSADWSQVRSYYHTPKNEWRVETENGSFTLHELTHRVLLKQAIQERAKWADVTSWEMKGEPRNTLDLTEPETFTINRKQMREYVFLLVMGCVVLPLLLLYTSISRWDAPLVLYQNLEQTWQTIGPWWALGTLFIYLFPGLVYGVLLAFGWPLAQFSRQRQGESITVSPEGILWRDATTGQQIWSPWKDVTDYHFDILPGWVKTKNLHVVKTTHGEIQFAGYNGSVRLRALIQKYCAQHSLQLEWENKRDGERSPRPDETSQVYNYRSSEMRAMLWLAIAYSFIISGILVLGYLGWLQPQERDDGDSPLFLVIPLLLGTAWLVWTYYRFQIITDESGITQYNGRRSKFIAWADITEYESVFGRFIVRSPDQTIRCWSSISHRKKLQEVIRERAVNSKTRDW